MSYVLAYVPTTRSNNLIDTRLFRALARVIVFGHYFIGHKLGEYEYSVVSMSKSKRKRRQASLISSYLLRRLAGGAAGGLLAGDNPGLRLDLVEAGLALEFPNFFH
jgi:hypothetical protein